MENNRSKKKVLALKALKWSFLIFLILVASFTILFGINMHAMQSTIISEIIQYIDTGELNKISVDRKGIVVNHYFLFYSLIISICCLITIIIFLSISLRIAKRELEQKYNQALADGRGSRAV